MKNQYLTSIFLLSLITSSTTIVQAQDYSAESDFFGESPVVLTVSRMHKPLEDSPVSVSVIDREMIRNSGAREIADIFRMVPGMIVGYRFGHSPAVTYQGLGSQWAKQMQVLIDGRSVFMPSFGGVPWANLPLLLEDIQRVEVTRGPNAVTYGSGAFLATINIITRHAAEDRGTKLSVSHDLDKDALTRDLYFKLGKQIGDLDWRLTGGREEDDGFTDIYDSKTLNKVNFRTDFLTSYNQFWTLQAGINESSFNRGDGAIDDIFRDEMASNSYQIIKWELVQDEVNTTLLFSHTKQDVDDRFLTSRLNEELISRFGAPSVLSLFPDITLDINFNRLSERSDLELYQNRSFGEDITLVYGASVRDDKVQSLYLFNDDDQHRVSTTRLFSSLEWQLRTDLSLDLGLMLEDTNLTDKELSSRLSIIKKINQHSLRFVSSSAKRNPTLSEVIGDIQFLIDIPGSPTIIKDSEGNPNAIPETIQSYEIGLLSQYLNKSLTTDIRVFSYTISDQIQDLKQSAAPQDFRVPLNVGETNAKGLEASVNYSPADKTYRVYGGLSRVSAKTRSPGDNNFFAGTESFPDRGAFAGGHINIDNAQQLSATLYYVDKVSWLDSADEIDDYVKLDLRYQYTFNRQFDTKLELIGYNLFEDFSDYSVENVQEKSLLLRISTRF